MFDRRRRDWRRFTVFTGPCENAARNTVQVHLVIRNRHYTLIRKTRRWVL